MTEARIKELEKINAGKAKKAKGMNEARIKSCEEINNWVWEVDRLGGWKETRLKLIAWRRQNGGNWPSQKSKIPEEKTLGNWTNTQRLNYRNKKKKLSNIRKKLMENMPGWTWKGNYINATKAELLEFDQALEEEEEGEEEDEVEEDADDKFT